MLSDFERLAELRKELHWQLSAAQSCCFNMNNSGLVHAMNAANAALDQIKNFRMSFQSEPKKFSADNTTDWMV